VLSHITVSQGTTIVKRIPALTPVLGLEPVINVITVIVTITHVQAWCIPSSSHPSATHSDARVQSAHQAGGGLDVPTSHTWMCTEWTDTLLAHGTLRCVQS
jgi:hypothetical protein